MKWAWGGGWRLPAFLCQTTSSPGFCPISRAHFRDRKTLRKRVHHKGPPCSRTRLLQEEDFVFRTLLVPLLRHGFEQKAAALAVQFSGSGGVPERRLHWRSPGSLPSLQTLTLRSASVHEGGLCLQTTTSPLPRSSRASCSGLARHLIEQGLFLEAAVAVVAAEGPNIGSKQRLLHRELPAPAGAPSRCRDPKRSKLVVRHRALAVIDQPADALVHEANVKSFLEALEPPSIPKLRLLINTSRARRPKPSPRDCG